MNNLKKNKALIFFVILTSVISVSTYFITGSMDNVFQAYSFADHLNPNTFPHLNVIALRITILIMILLLFEKLQTAKWQLFIMIFLLLFLVIGLCFPISLYSYPIISALSRIIFNVMEAWRQMYVPSAFRGTIEGFTDGLTGVFDFFGVSIETSWLKHLGYYHYFAPLFFILLVLFWQLASIRINKKGATKATPSHLKKTESIRYLLTQYPYVFMACFLGGFSESIFDYTFLLGKEFRPDFSPLTYQYTLFIGDILLPMIIGRIADKKGIYTTILFSGIAITFITFISAIFFATNTNVSTLYATAFIEGGLAGSLWPLSVSLIGERLRLHGIFRSFAIYNIVFVVGSIFAGRVYTYFAGSFCLTKLCIGFFYLLIIALILYFHNKPRLIPTRTNKVKH